MPFLTSIPRGLSAAIQLLDSLEAPQQRVRIESALLKMYGHPESRDLTLSALTEQQEQSLQEALLFIYRCAESSKVATQEFFDEVQMLTPLSDATVQVMAKIWSQKSRYVVSGPTTDSADGEGEGTSTTHGEHGSLLGVDWVLGINMSSSQCARVQEPYVVVNFKVAAGQGRVESHTIEMTIPEFRKLKQEFESMSAALERS
eukprot:c17504_g1_i1.p1 GENE.c17504_g1_i1~~c17504_g1_i1.p1  ORF type:complete len:202 (-),score=45.73 c17504_g1_i1:214-819(-)